MLDAKRVDGGSALASDGVKKGTAPRGKGRRRDDESANGSVGRALRIVYQQTVDETVPDDMLELLRKLG